MLGAFLAFLAAAFFGLNNATVRRGVLKGSVLQGLAITVPLGVPLFLVAAAAMGGFAALPDWPATTWIWMALAGVVHFVFGRYGNYRATQSLGGTLATPMQQMSIPVALTLAIIFLGERLTALNLAGIGLILIGPMVVVQQRKASSAKARAKGFEPAFLPGLAWGAVGAFCYGTSPLLISLGLDAARQNGGGHGMADSMAGGLVSYSAATVVVAGLVLAAGGRRYMATIDRNTRRWFYLSAFLVALSQVFRYLALAIAPVSVVVPIQRLTVIFRIIFNGILNRDHEVIDLWIVVTILLSLIGVVALTMDGPTLLGALGIGGALAELLVRPIL